MTIGQSIRKARKEKGYSLEALAYLSGVTFTTISQWERDVRTPILANLILVADALQMPLDELIGRTVPR
jgi:transcriptional regulator with XRE-family HTH domain